MPPPLVTVLLPARNAALLVERAVNVFAIALFFTGCAASPLSGEASSWFGHDGLLSAQDGPTRTESGRRHAVDIDLEAPPPAQTKALQQRGVSLPRVSGDVANPQTHRDYVDLRVTEVGIGITSGGYLLFCQGLPLPVLVPESHVDLAFTSAEPPSTPFIYPDRDAALEAGRHQHRTVGVAYYRGAGGALIVPTLFSRTTTPRIAQAMLEAREHLSETVQQELRVMLLTLSGTKVLQGVFSRVVRVGREGLGHEPPTPKPSTPPAHSTSAPAALPPSRGLVQTLVGNNPTLPMSPAVRLPRDVAISPTVPRARPKTRPIGSSSSQNAQLQADIEYLEDMGATNIRVNQQQITVRNGQRVGANRPDLQFDYNGRRYHVEYDTPGSGRASGHQSRLTSNDPNAEILLLLVP